MLKKTATNSLKQQSEKLRDRLDKKLSEAEELIKTTGMPSGAPAAPESVLDNLLAECEDHTFWLNFRKAAPMLFCAAMEHNSDVKQVRDLSFMEELLKVKSMMSVMSHKLSEGDAGIDIIEYTMATQMLENKLAVLKSLNTTVDGDNDEKLTFNIQGTNKAVQIDLKKLQDAITFLDKPVEERQASAEDHMTKIEEIDISDITEEAFVEQVVQKIGDVKKNENKTLHKDTFIKIFKYTGDFAKLRSKDIKKKAQEERVSHFDKDHKQYLEALQKTVQEEEKAYEASSQIIFDKLCITPENFERSQQQHMNDPSVQMELFNLGIKMEQPASKAPADLAKDKVVELVTKSNDFAFDYFKKHFLDVMSKDPMIMPVLISAIAHDWVFVNHNWTEDQFKAALFEHKIYEDPNVARHMQSKQFELMMLAQQHSPMMGMGGPGMGGPGMGMGGPGMGMGF
jgi:hypothetical protein